MKKFFRLLFAFILIVSLSTNFVFAHPRILNIEYDNCMPEENIAGENELWYNIDRMDTRLTKSSIHLSHQTEKIKYYFSPNEEGNTDNTWIYYVKFIWNERGVVLSDAQAQSVVVQIQNIIVDSMKKWNDVYYYQYDSNGNIESSKIINIEEGSIDDNNLIIYPTTLGSVAGIPLEFVTEMQPSVESGHYHRRAFTMLIGIHEFYDILQNPETINSAKSIAYRENAGAHEVGHILGLADLDEWDCACQCVYCTDSDTGNNSNCTNLGHHEEALMGYGEHANRTLHITYRDIAGASITRGFHTDNDHLWMFRENRNNVTNILVSVDAICALCNGVRINIDVEDDEYADLYDAGYIYKSCTHYDNHNEGMILVATDGVRDFYKCRYCRLIEEVEFNSIGSVPVHSAFNYNSNLTYGQCYKINVPYSGNYNFKVTCNSELKFSLWNDDWEIVDSFTNDVLATNGGDVYLDSGYYYLRLQKSSATSISFNLRITPHSTHNYTEWAPYSLTQHIECCECGAKGTIKKNHVIKSSETTLLKSKCLICGALVDATGGFGESFIQNIQKVTINGSYILPNGIIVLVDEDIEAYLNGTLVFYDKGNVPQVQ